MGDNRVSRRKTSLIVAGLAALAAFAFECDTARASVLNSCTTYCHGMPPRDATRKGNPHFDSQSSAFLGNHRNHLSASPVAVECGGCHTSVAATDFGHQNDVIAMANSLKGYSSATIRAQYDKGRFFNQTSIPNLASATCSNVSCHFETRTPAWGSTPFAAPASCNACHGFPPSGTTVAPVGGLAGSHARHNAYFPGSIGCQKCHPVYSGFAHATTAGRPLKVQGYLRDPLDILEAGATYSGSGTSYLPSASGATVFGSCSNSYCHSTGQSTTGAGAGTPVTSPVWGGTITCGSCHVDMATSAAATGSHVLHAQGSGTAYSCDICHGSGFNATTANIATHVNKQINLTFTGNASGTTYAKGSAFAPGSSVYSSCATSNCHGAMNPTWGGNTAKSRCQKCHGYRSAAWNALNGATATTDAKVGAHFSHISSAGAVKYARSFSCAECHATSVALATDNVNAAGHFDTAGPAEVSFNTLAKTNASIPTYGAAVCASNYCHGANMASNLSNPPASRIASPTWNAPFLGVPSVVGNGSTTPGSGDCATCHGYPPMTATHTGKIATECSNCHPHVNASGTGFINVALHVDGKVDAQGGDCTGCHASVQGGRRVAVMGQFTATLNSHHYQGTAKLDKTVCYACHWEADATGGTTTHHREQTAGFTNKVQLVVWGTSTTRPTTYNTSTYVLYSSGGTNASSRAELAKINTHCLGCHNDTNRTTQPFATDTGTPAKYSWEGLSTAFGGFGTVQSIGTKYLSTTTTNWGKYAGNNVNSRQSQIKAFSAHGNAVVNQRGWSTIAEVWNTAVANFPNTSGSTNNVLCFDCHNSHGSFASAPANARTSSYSSATGRNRGGILKDTIAGQGGYTVSYRPYTGGSPTAKNPYKTGAGLCFDCHNNATVGSPTSPGSATPWGYSGTFNSAQLIHGYNDNPYFGKAGGTFAKGITYPYIAIGGLTVNKGGHLFASSAMTTTPNFRINGLCTACHDPHGVSPGIAAGNQQYAVPMLKGTFVTSPYKQDATPANTNESRGGGSEVPVQSVGSTPGYHIDQNTMQAPTVGKPATARYWTFGTAGTTLQTLTDSQFAGLCLKCHNKTDLNNTAAASSANWKTMKRIHNAVAGWAATGGSNAGNAVHSYTCSKCHSTHNSNLPRLMVTNCLDVKHRGRLSAGGNVGLQTTTFGSRGAGLGRFAGGGGYGHTRNATTATNPGPWFFGTRVTTVQVTATNLVTTRTCHEQPTAGGTWTTNGTTELWNTKTPW